MRNAQFIETAVPGPQFSVELAIGMRLGAGLVVNFWPDETGRPVERVTFRLDRFQEGG